MSQSWRSLLGACFILTLTACAAAPIRRAPAASTTSTSAVSAVSSAGTTATTASQAAIANDVLPAKTPSFAVAASTTATPMASGGAIPAVTYDFRSDAGGWYTGTTTAQTVTMGDGHYNVALKQPNIHGVYFPKTMPGGGNQTIQANVAMTSTDGVAGVTARFVNNNDQWSFYLCAITHEGQYGCWIVVDGRYTNLVKWTKSPVIHADQMNTLTLTVEGPTLSLSINGTPVASAHDTTLTSGYPGLYVEAYDQVPVSATFSNVEAAVAK